MSWVLKVSEYGKIKSAEIEMAPLTLFVGDNNSGKSYLMSLLWGIQNLGTSAIFIDQYEKNSKEEELLLDWLKTQMEAAWERGSHTTGVEEIADILQTALNLRLRRGKDSLVKLIFNSMDVKIKDLEIEIKELEKVSLKFEISDGKEEKTLSIKNNNGTIYGINYSDIEQLNTMARAWIILLFILVTGIGSGGNIDKSGRIYLPAARTGFMLTKDIINKVGRNSVFNIDTNKDKIVPFVRPINQFLDVMNDLTFDGKGDEKFNKIALYLENGMAEGTISMSTLPNREVVYIPEGQESGIPLRIASAVVTELSPLILILKHKSDLHTLFYEEPEMCLHPQLQQKMARVICQLTNAHLEMVVTTHSDIILQHINNMIRLSKREDSAEICKQLGYTPDDLLDANQVKVYQLKSKPGEKTSVEELVCGENGFAIPTFNDALDRILDESYLIQE